MGCSIHKPGQKIALCVSFSSNSTNVDGVIYNGKQQATKSLKYGKIRVHLKMVLHGDTGEISV